MIQIYVIIQFLYLETSDVMLLEKVYDDIYYNDLIFLIKHHQNLIE